MEALYALPTVGGEGVKREKSNEGDSTSDGVWLQVDRAESRRNMEAKILDFYWWDYRERGRLGQRPKRFKTVASRREGGVLAFVVGGGNFSR